MIENLHERCKAAFERRFGKTNTIEFINLEAHRLVRVTDPKTRAWVDYDTTAWRVRAVAWNGPEPQVT